MSRSDTLVVQLTDLIWFCTASTSLVQLHLMLSGLGISQPKASACCEKGRAQWELGRTTRSSKSDPINLPWQLPPVGQLDASVFSEYTPHWRRCLRYPKLYLEARERRNQKRPLVFHTTQPPWRRPNHLIRLRGRLSRSHTCQLKHKSNRNEIIKYNFHIIF